MEILQPQQKIQFYRIYFVLQIPTELSISTYLSDGCWGRKLLSMTAAALSALARATVYSIRTAKKILIIFLLMANIRRFVFV